VYGSSNFVYDNGADHTTYSNSAASNGYMTLGIGTTSGDLTTFSEGTANGSPSGTISVSVTNGSPITIKYTLTNVIDGNVTINITNSNAILVRTIDCGVESSGIFTTTWDGTYANGQSVPPGAYMVNVSVIYPNYSQQVQLQYVTSLDEDFNGPNFIATGSDGNLYVTDWYNNRVKVFAANGTYLFDFGSPGNGNGQFNNPCGVAVNSTGYVYVTDWNNNRVEVFNATGSYVSQFGSSGNGNGQFEFPDGLAINSSGYVYVADLLNNRTEVFNATGSYVTQLTTNGTGKGHMLFPRDLAFNSTGYLYVLDSGNYCVDVFDANNNPVSQFGVNGISVGIAVDPAGYVYVGDTGNNQTEVYDANGIPVYHFGSYGLSIGYFYNPMGIAFGSPGTVYVADSLNNRVQEFSLPNTTISSEAQVETSYMLNLVSGWNLISVPLNVSDNSIEDFFPADVLDGIVDVWGWNESAQNWMYYSPDPVAWFAANYPAITNMEAGNAYWVEMNKSASFTVNGTIPSSAPASPVGLGSSWNFVGPTGLIASTPEELYPGNVVDVWGWNATAQNWVYYSPDPVAWFAENYPELTSISPGNGYWVELP
jgi:sugar lactone lactonase YvrE